MARRQIVFLTRPGCGLCDEALPRVRTASRWLQRDLVVEEIAARPDLEDLYALRIPVVLADDGRVLAEGKVGYWAAVKAAALG